MRCKWLLTLAVVCLTCLSLACSRKPKAEVAFYYWKSTVADCAAERAVLHDNGARRLYVRYFDIKLDDHHRPIPETPLRGSLHRLPQLSIIPVVYIKNDVFLHTSPDDLRHLAQRCAALVAQMNARLGVKMVEVQFDCDWTRRTKADFFAFLRLFRQFCPVRLSATIRLHQLKYASQTGVPPVDVGTLMYYNMSSLNADTLNSVYDRATALRYLSAKPYPLPLNVALPIFSWGVKVRDGQVVQLLSKWTEEDLRSNACFKAVSDHRFAATQSHFYRGIYFKQGDEVKVERVTADELRQMADDLAQRLGRPVQEVIFFDLDTLNTKQYDKALFQKVAHRLA